MNDKERVKEVSKKKSDRSCDRFHEAIEFIGKRWMGIIIYRLLDGPKRYHELLTEIEGISDRLLTERLRELVNYGLVIKSVSQTQARKVEYELTGHGIELKEIIRAIVKWTDKNSEDTNNKAK